MFIYDKTVSDQQINKEVFMKRNFTVGIKQSIAQLVIKAFVLLSFIGLSAISLAADKNATKEQETLGGRIKIIPTLGYTNFKLSGMRSEGSDTNSLSFKSKGGNSIGVLSQIPIDEKLDFETGLEYFESGGSYTLDSGFFSLTLAELKLSYLAIPLRAKYMFNSPNTEGFRYYGKGGITATYLTQAKYETFLGTSQDVKSDMNSVDVLLNGGVGLDWQAAGGRANFDFNYNYGTQKVSKSAGGKAEGFMLQLGYAIEI